MGDALEPNRRGVGSPTTVHVERGDGARLVLSLMGAPGPSPGEIGIFVRVDKCESQPLKINATESAVTGHRARSHSRSSMRSKVGSQNRSSVVGKPSILLSPARNSAADPRQGSQQGSQIRPPISIVATAGPYTQHLNGGPSQYSPSGRALPVLPPPPGDRVAAPSRLHPLEALPVPVPAPPRPADPIPVPPPPPAAAATPEAGTPASQWNMGINEPQTLLNSKRLPALLPKKGTPVAAKVTKLTVPPPPQSAVLSTPAEATGPLPPPPTADLSGNLLGAAAAGIIDQQAAVLNNRRLAPLPSRDKSRLVPVRLENVMAGQQQQQQEEEASGSGSGGAAPPSPGSDDSLVGGRGQRVSSHVMDWIDSLPPPGRTTTADSKGSTGLQVLARAGEILSQVSGSSFPAPATLSAYASGELPTILEDRSVAARSAAPSPLQRASGTNIRVSGTNVRVSGTNVRFSDTNIVFSESNIDRGSSPVPDTRSISPVPSQPNARPGLAAAAAVQGQNSILGRVSSLLTRRNSAQVGLGAVASGAVAEPHLKPGPGGSRWSFKFKRGIQVMPSVLQELHQPDAYVPPTHEGSAVDDDEGEGLGTSSIAWGQGGRVQRASNTGSIAGPSLQLAPDLLPDPLRGLGVGRCRLHVF